jgi:hypothetical protein
VEDPSVYRAAYGFRAWQQGFDGVMDYAYQDSMGSIYDDVDHPQFRDHVFAYPTVDGVIGTIAWEGFREAVDDIRYLTVLMRRASQGNSKSASQAVAAIRTSLEPDPARLRQQVVAAIMKLCSEVRSDQVESLTCLP